MIFLPEDRRLLRCTLEQQQIGDSRVTMPGTIWGIDLETPYKKKSGTYYDNGICDRDWHIRRLWIGEKYVCVRVEGFFREMD